MKLFPLNDQSLEESGFSPFVQASTARADREDIRGVIGEFHATDPASQAAPERPVRRLPPRDLVADPDKKDSGEKNQEADEHEP